jgi:hypothetical protein
MVPRLRAQLHEIRLLLHGAWLERVERAALGRLGREVVRAKANGGDGELQRLVDQVATVHGRIEALRAERGSSVAADRADMAVVSAWVRPAVIVRGVATRLVLRHHGATVRRMLRPLYEAIGRRAANRAEFWYPLEREVTMVRGAIARVRAERERYVAPYGDPALPRWTRGVGREALGFGQAVGRQLRGQFLPKAPAIAGLVAGWWVANTYTDSHLKSALRSLGLGSGGTRVVSSSTYDAMHFWLPLLAAALCAYLGERIGAFYGAGEVTEERTPAAR